MIVPLGGLVVVARYVFAFNTLHNLIVSLCCQKAKHMAGQAQSYAEKYGLPVRTVQEMIHEELLSDEASGPEGEEDPAAWKVRMAQIHGLRDLSPAALKKERFLEVLECPWRSDEVFFDSPQRTSH
jgi:hypothetical protein